MQTRNGDCWKKPRKKKGSLSHSSYACLYKQVQFTHFVIDIWASGCSSRSSFQRAWVQLLRPTWFFFCSFFFNYCLFSSFPWLQFFQLVMFLVSVLFCFGPLLVYTLFCLIIMGSFIFPPLHLVTSCYSLQCIYL